MSSIAAAMGLGESCARRAMHAQPQHVAASAGNSATLEQATALQPECCRFCGSELCSAESHEGLCSNLERTGLLQRQSPLALAFRKVDRMDFVPSIRGSTLEDIAYTDCAVYLEFGAQISAPHVYAHSLRLLFPEAAQQQLERGQCDRPVRVLDLGSGSGFAAAVLARFLELLQPGCIQSSVLAVEHIEELVTQSMTNLERHQAELLSSGRLQVRCGDARELLVQEPELCGVFDAVHCGCAVDTGDGVEAPAWLVDALAPGGRAVFPRGVADTPQRLCVVERSLDGHACKVLETDIAVLYVPATSEKGQRARGDVWDNVVALCRRNATRFGY